MLHIVNVSGGMGSFAEAYLTCELYGKENTRLLFADTLVEDKDLYRFLDETVQFLGCPLIRLCEGRTPWRVCFDRRFIANSRVDVCSETLKRSLLNGYIKRAYNPEEVNVHVGIDYTECHRLERLQKRMSPYIYRSILVERGFFVPKDYSERFGIRKPRLYDYGFAHNNCGGFCFKAGLGQFKKLWEILPERYMENEIMEQIILDTIPSTRPFLSKQVKGERIYITMRQYREEYLEKSTCSEDEFDIGGCGCALE
jgi:hypothetical protein